MFRVTLDGAAVASMVFFVCLTVIVCTIAITGRSLDTNNSKIDCQPDQRPVLVESRRSHLQEFDRYTCGEEGS